MERYERSFELGVPLRTAYNQFTQFEDFPSFMHELLDVEQKDDTHLHWRVAAEGREEDFDVEILEQVPDELIAWQTTSDPPDSGEVRFEGLPDERTRLCFAMEYELETGQETAEQIAALVACGVERAIAQFKRFIEARGAETGGWRGEVHAGRRTGPAGVGTPEEPLPADD